MKNKIAPFIETLIILLGELAVSLIICAVYLALGEFSYKVPLGALLGSAVTVLNFLFLSITTNRAFDKIVEARGTAEFSDEEAEKFAKDHQAELSSAVKLSFIVRTLTMLAALVIAFLLDWFDPIATVIPLLMLRPILSLQALIKTKIESKNKKEDN